MNIINSIKEGRCCFCNVLLVYGPIYKIICPQCNNYELNSYHKGLYVAINTCINNFYILIYFKIRNKQPTDIDAAIYTYAENIATYHLKYDISSYNVDEINDYLTNLKDNINQLQKQLLLC